MFRVYIIHARGFKMYYTGHGLITDWSADITKARKFTFLEVTRFVGKDKNRYIEEVSQ